MLLTVELNIV